MRKQINEPIILVFSNQYLVIDQLAGWFGSSLFIDLITPSWSTDIINAMLPQLCWLLTRIMDLTNHLPPVHKGRGLGHSANELRKLCGFPNRIKNSTFRYFTETEGWYQVYRDRTNFAVYRKIDAHVSCTVVLFVKPLLRKADRRLFLRVWCKSVVEEAYPICFRVYSTKC